MWLANFRINERKVSDYRRGRVMLAGDAAHIHSPAGGQGMNTGMQDAFNLAWKLALVHRGEAQTEALLGSYSIERSKIGDQVLRGAAAVTTVGTLRNPVAQFLRDHIAPVIASFGFVQDRIRNTLCELSINYRHGPLSEETWRGPGGDVAAGDRLPDAPLLSAADGESTTLFAAIRGKGHALLLLPGTPENESAAKLVKIADDVARAFPDVFSSHVILNADTQARLDPADSSVPVWLDQEGVVHRKFHATGRRRSWFDRTDMSATAANRLTGRSWRSIWIGIS